MAEADATTELRQIIRENEIPDVGYVEQLLKMGADPNTRGGDNDDNDTPRKYFKTKKKATEAIIKSIRASESDQIESVTYVEIECENKILLLLYFDSDSWTLGWGDSVVVVNSLDELTEEDGYYTRL